MPAFQLLFEFAAARHKVTPSALMLEQIDSGLVSAFLGSARLARPQRQQVSMRALIKANRVRRRVLRVPDGSYEVAKLGDASDTFATCEPWPTSASVAATCVLSGLDQLAG